MQACRSRFFGESLLTRMQPAPILFAMRPKSTTPKPGASSLDVRLHKIVTHPMEKPTQAGMKQLESAIGESV